MTPTDVTPPVSAFIAGWGTCLLIALLTSLVHARKGAPGTAPVERHEALPGALPPYGAPGGGPTTS